MRRPGWTIAPCTIWCVSPVRWGGWETKRLGVDGFATGGPLDGGRRPVVDTHNSEPMPGWKWKSNMLVKRRYIREFNKIRRRYGEAPAGYVVEKNATLEDSIGYTERYVVGRGKPHFRYDYYMGALEEAAREFDCIHPGRKIIHVDLGCGPGLFAWVVHDYVTARCRKNGDSLSFYLYDHSENMIKLAKKFRKKLLTEHHVRFYHDAKAMRNRLRSGGLANYDVLVTFGHVLIQTRNDRRALREFSRVIRELSLSNSCTIIAVDAYSGWRRSEFRDACDKLAARLRKFGVDHEVVMGPNRSCMYARLTRRK